MAEPTGPAPDLAHVRWTHRPSLRAPVLVAGFSGWSDAGDAASSATEFLAEAWGAETFASLDPETFYDFTTTRPRVEFDDEGERRVIWPEVRFAAATVPGAGVDVLIVGGPEPQLRWPTFCRQVIGVALELGSRRSLSLGALLAEVPHARPVSMFGVGHDERTAADLQLLPSSYEGPTGITGVLHTACRDAGLAASSLWATVPTYVPSAPSPKATMALVERAGRLLDVQLDLADLALASREYEDEVSALVDEDDETRDYVRSLEERYDLEGPGLLGDPTRLVEEVERFLRDQD